MVLLPGAGSVWKVIKTDKLLTEGLISQLFENSIQAMKYVMRDVAKIFRRNRYELIDKQSKQESGYYIVAMTYWLYLLCEQQLFPFVVIVVLLLNLLWSIGLTVPT